MTLGTDYKTSAELCQKIADKSNGTCLLAFSTGKDALSAWVELRKYFHTIHPVYYYMVPGLSFVEKSLNYYENYFGTRIYRLPNPNLYRMINNGTYQTRGTWDIVRSFEFPTNIKREELCELLKLDFKIDPLAYTAIGNRMYDSLQRYRSITKFGAINERIKTFNPTYDFRIKDVVDSIKSAPGLQLPVDYKIWGKTFDGLDYRFIRPLLDIFPDDYKKIKAVFPLLDVEILRYEKVS